jgi:hypothetical protein
MCTSTTSAIRNSTGSVADIPDSLMSIEIPGSGPSLLDRTVTSTSNLNLACRRVSATAFPTNLARQKLLLLFRRRRLQTCCHRIFLMPPNGFVLPKYPLYTVAMLDQPAHWYNWP